MGRTHPPGDGRARRVSVGVRFHTHAVRTKNTQGSLRKPNLVIGWFKFGTITVILWCWRCCEAALSDGLVPVLTFIALNGYNLEFVLGVGVEKIGRNHDTIC